MLYILLAVLNLSTTYGHGEWNCGDIGEPRPCAAGAVTASGEAFLPSAPSMAVPAPTELRWRTEVVGIEAADGQCQEVRVNDKANPRYIGNRGFDVTPGVLRVIDAEHGRRWRGRIRLCELDANAGFNPESVVPCGVMFAQFSSINGENITPLMKSRDNAYFYGDERGVKFTLKFSRIAPIRHERPWIYVSRCVGGGETFHVYVKHNHEV